MKKTVTLVIHGTFASEAKWWRLGSEGKETFADRLERELSRRGLSGTVWQPVLAKGFKYSSFSWSGQNRHRDRLTGAWLLGSSLNQLAQRVLATPGDPLTVNFVAHSHGGNVVFEALRHLKPNVRIGRIALLGTPLITARPAFRIARIIFSAIILTLLFLGLFMFLIDLGSLLFTGHLFERTRIIVEGGRVARETIKGGFLLAITLPMVFLYEWILWMLGKFLDVAWRVICRLFEPLIWLQGKDSLLVYGPSPRKLAMSLRGQPILLLTSHDDEADLLLQIGSAPARLYREYIAERFSRLQRLFEFVFIRPFVLGMFLKVVEMFLEVFSLGFPVWRALVQDFEVVSVVNQPYYPSHLLVQEWVEAGAVRLAAAVRVGDDEYHNGGVESSVAIPGYLSLQEITNEIKRQIQQRHYAYHENESVLTRVAEFLTGAEVRGTKSTRPASLKPSAEFWEVLLSVNLVLLCILWIASPQSVYAAALVLFILITGYVLPFASLGIVLVLYHVIKRPMPDRLWHWFWIIWVICVLVGSLFAHAFLRTPL